MAFHHTSQRKTICKLFPIPTEEIEISATVKFSRKRGMLFRQIPYDRIHKQLLFNIFIEEYL